jgi:predicted nucleic acid-binding Zn ribbon protein
VRRDGADGPRPVGESLPRVLGRLGAAATPATMEAVFTRWSEIAGADLSEHVRPVRVDDRVLVVAADHPAWATRARMQSGRILAQVGVMGDHALERLEVVVERT